MVDYHGYKVYTDGSIVGLRGWKLKPVIDSTGYYCHSIRVDGKMRTIRLHRIIAECFIPNPDGLPVINHKDGNKLNNSIDNLEWCTFSHNSKHAIDTGLNKKPPTHLGEKQHLSKLTADQVLEIRSLYPKYNTYELSELYKISQASIHNIVSRKTWKHL